VFDGFGLYEDELVKVNGSWLFTKRKIYNEGRDEWAYKDGRTRHGSLDQPSAVRRRPT
jgi:hypothetical protein